MALIKKDPKVKQPLLPKLWELMFSSLLHPSCTCRLTVQSQRERNQGLSIIHLAFDSLHTLSQPLCNLRYLRGIHGYAV